MALNIKDADADRLARELAESTGESLTVAVRAALRERLDRVRGSARGEHTIEELNEIAQRCAALPVLDDRSEEAILGYDDVGLPQT